jgi:hypothetical protein
MQEIVRSRQFRRESKVEYWVWWGQSKRKTGKQSFGEDFSFAPLTSMLYIKLKELLFK